MAELQNLNSKIQEAKFQPSDSNLQISTGDDMSQKYWMANWNFAIKMGGWGCGGHKS